MANANERVFEPHSSSGVLRAEDSFMRDERVFESGCIPSSVWLVTRVKVRGDRNSARERRKKKKERKNERSTSLVSLTTALVVAGKKKIFLAGN